MEELLAGLDHGERVQRLGGMLDGIKQGERVGRLGEQLDGIEKPPRPDCAPPLPTGSNGQTTADGRDGQSKRFGPGNKFGHGNPHARRQAALRAVLSDAVDEQRLRKVAAKLADLAEGGDLEAIKLLFAYLLGKPGPAPDPDRLDLDEWRLLDASPTVAEATRAVLDTVAPAAANERLVEQFEKSFGERLGETKCDARTREILAVQDKRCGRKRKPSAAIPG